MSTNSAARAFVLDYVVSTPRPRLIGGWIAITAMLLVLLLALAASFYGSGAGDGADATEIMQGP